MTTIEAGMSGYEFGRPVMGGMSWRDTHQLLRYADKIEYNKQKANS